MTFATGGVPHAGPQQEGTLMSRAQRVTASAPQKQGGLEVTSWLQWLPPPSHDPAQPWKPDMWLNKPKNTPERGDSVLLRHKLFLQLVFKCNILNIKDLTMLCPWWNGWYWAYYPATNKLKSWIKYSKLLFAGFWQQTQAVIPEMKEAHMWASHSSLLLPESIFQTLAQGLEPKWRTQALWTEKWRPELSAKWLWFREGRAQSCREGSPKVCMVFVCHWLTQSSGCTGPWENSHGRPAQSWLQCSEMLRTLEFGPSQVGLTGRGLGVRTTPRCEHQFWEDSQMEVVVQLVSNCSLPVLKKGLEKNSRLGWSLKDE